MALQQLINQGRRCNGLTDRHGVYPDHRTGSPRNIPETILPVIENAGIIPTVSPQPEKQKGHRNAGTQRIEKMKHASPAAINSGTILHNASNGVFAAKKGVLRKLRTVLLQ